MIARLSGTLVEKQPGLLIIDVAGVGYEVSVTLSTYRTAGRPGDRVELHVHTHAREGALALYGFGSRLEKSLFARLIDVNGVGPRLAIAVLSGLGAAEVIDVVRQRDPPRMATVPGIGRKTAERIVLELADRLEDLAESGAATQDGAPIPSLRQDLISALVNLGYNPRVAAHAAGEVLQRETATPPPLETLLRQTLKQLSR